MAYLCVMNRIDRLTAILILLQSHKVLTAETVARRFGISRRTVYRDLKALDEAGVPIGAEAGVGFFLAEGYCLPPVMFTRDEAAALFTAGKVVEKLTDVSVDLAYKTALEKIKAVLPMADKDFLETLNSNTEVFFYTQAGKPGFPNRFLTMLQQAASRHQQVYIDYCPGNSHETTKKRLVEPILVCFYSMAWHLLAFCRLRNDYRDFRLDRIQQVSVGEHFFKAHPIKSALEYFTVQNPKQANFKIVLRFDKGTAISIRNIRYYYGYTHETEREGITEMHFISSDLEHFSRWLLMYADMVEIVEPNALRMLFTEKLCQIKDKYRDVVVW